jgi:transglutaminase-like putative cysteine protease
MLCVLTAATLAALSTTTILLRRFVGGEDAWQPYGPGAWRITLVVRGFNLGGARLLTAVPLDLERQNVVSDQYASEELTWRPPEARHPQRHQVIWTARNATAPGPLHARCTYHVAIDSHHPNTASPGSGRGLYATPRGGEYLEPAIGPGSETQRLFAVARERGAGLDNPIDVAEALYHFVDREVANEPYWGELPIEPADCLRAGRGDSAAKSRLLVALLRIRGVPARIMTGLALTKGPEQHAHHWVEAWMEHHWLPMCTVYHHFGRIPATNMRRER